MQDDQEESRGKEQNTFPPSLHERNKEDKKQYRKKALIRKDRKKEEQKPRDCCRPLCMTQSSSPAVSVYKGAQLAAERVALPGK